MIELTATPTTIFAGTRTKLTVTIHNTGPDSCRKIRLRLERPNGLLFVEGSGSIDVPWLDAGAHDKRTITVVAERPGRFRVGVTNFSYLDTAKGFPQYEANAALTLEAVRARIGPVSDIEKGDGSYPTERGKVFISYRWADAEGQANHLYRELCLAFGSSWVHLDRDQYRIPGQDFRQRLDAALAASTAMLVLIGPKWNPMIDDVGVRRLGTENDVVRYEIRTGLRNGMYVIPVVIGKAEMPRSEDLPEDVRDLVYKDLAVYTTYNVKHDICEIVRALRPHVGGLA